MHKNTFNQIFLDPFNFHQPEKKNPLRIFKIQEICLNVLVIFMKHPVWE